MNVECRFFGPFREAVGEERVTVDADVETYGDLLALLEDRYPALDGRLLDADGTGLAGRTVVSRNTTDIRHLDGVDTPVEPGDVVRAIPSVYGG
ncbi:thiamine biosynthesis protein ThiS [Halorubrum sp. JWXQ-INN 858]|uniref:ubiquitin-like small modifier protein 1 n=1 Tax=Halorubrum sp. JWXQ-INN 858 TaxID=2690782 RepID=UPI0013FAAB78|nr:ubiquitin-like small modifier protein 1 [Halorubrum sp. JWXQ-INN 858]MWV63885.1 thiamine biosynthesis protein ThiS [Halorubrum sp. JWXQ-INN 858]